MSDVWVTSAIIGLSLAPSNRFLFARICYRAAGAEDGICRDTNPELSEAINVPASSMKDLISALVKAGLIQSNLNKESGYKRELVPQSQYLQPYLENNEEWRKKHGIKGRSQKAIQPTETPTPYGQITHSPYRQITHSLWANCPMPMGVFPLAYGQITHSIYKEENIIEKEEDLLEEATQKKEGKNKGSNDQQVTTDVPKEEPPKRADPFLRKSVAEKCNVPFSTWFIAYQYRKQEEACRDLWPQLSDEERTQAITHTPEYVKSTPDKSFRKNPLAYLQERVFNDEIVFRTGNDPPKQKPTPVPVTNLKKGNPD